MDVGDFETCDRCEDHVPSADFFSLIDGPRICPANRVGPA